MILNYVHMIRNCFFFFFFLVCFTGLNTEAFVHARSIILEVRASEIDLPKLPPSIARISNLRKARDARFSQLMQDSSIKCNIRFFLSRFF